MAKSKDIEIDELADKLIGEAETLLPGKALKAFKKDVLGMRGRDQRTMRFGRTMS